MNAAAEGRLAVVKRLLQARANTELCNAKGKNALQYAERHQRVAIINLLRAHAPVSGGDPVSGGGGGGEARDGGISIRAASQAVPTPLPAAAMAAPTPASPSPVAPPAERRLPAGQRVLVRGLSARPDLNGRFGTIGSYSAERGRYHVDIEPRADETGVLDKVCARCSKLWTTVPAHSIHCPAPCGGQLVAQPETIALRSQNVEVAALDVD